MMTQQKHDTTQANEDPLQNTARAVAKEVSSGVGVLSTAAQSIDASQPTGVKVLGKIAKAVKLLTPEEKHPQASEAENILCNGLGMLAKGAYSKPFYKAALTTGIGAVNTPSLLFKAAVGLASVTAASTSVDPIANRVGESTRQACHATLDWVLNRDPSAAVENTPPPSNDYRTNTKPVEDTIEDPSAHLFLSSMRTSSESTMTQTEFNQHINFLRAGVAKIYQQIVSEQERKRACYGLVLEHARNQMMKGLEHDDEAQALKAQLDEAYHTRAIQPGSNEDIELNVHFQKSIGMRREALRAQRQEQQNFQTVQQIGEYVSGIAHLIGRWTKNIRATISRC